MLDQRTKRLLASQGNEDCIDDIVYFVSTPSCQIFIMERRSTSRDISSIDLVFQCIMNLCLLRRNDYGIGADLKAFCAPRIGYRVRSNDEMYMTNTVMSGQKQRRHCLNFKDSSIYFG